MYAEPADIDRAELVAILRDAWELVVSALDYEPVGFGSHHYIVSDDRAGKWFITVDALGSQSWLGAYDIDSSLDVLDRAFRTTVALRRANLDFVLAPIETDDGNVIARLGDHYAVTTFPFVEGKSNPDGAHASVEERRLVLEALGRLHAASDVVPSGLPRRDTLKLPDREHLLQALDELGSPWSAGPYSEPTRLLLNASAGAVTDLIDRYDELTRIVSGTPESWVVTHGEPHGANVMRTTDGALLLIDWGTVAIAPRERDLWMVGDPRDADDWAAYTKHAPSPPASPAAIRLYRDWWALAEIAGYTQTFRSPHDDDANARAAWTNLQDFVPAPSQP